MRVWFGWGASQLLYATIRAGRAGCRQLAWSLAAAGLGLATALLHANAVDTPVNALEPASAAALHDLRTFASTGRVLYVAAHPDDENTQLIAYLSRARGYDTAYLSITRGDGGQNLLGPQLDEKLGLARTHELLAARRLDGGRQFFTRAIDFGFSKTPEETLAIWNRQEVLGDVVRVIRKFRPDVIVTRFPIPPGSGGHGHHTASAILAVEAFRLAGDAHAFPEQLAQGLSVWQPRRILWNAGRFFGRSDLEKNPTITLEISGNDPVTGEPLSAIAGRSRAMHKTQGFGEFAARGPGRPTVQTETLVYLAGDAPEHDLMDGVDTTWARIPGGAEIGGLAAEALTGFKTTDPGASLPALLAIRQRLAALAPGVIVDEKRAQLDEVIQHCLGLDVSCMAERATVVPGETLRFVATLTSTVPVRWRGVQLGGTTTAINLDVAPGQPASRELRYPVAKGTPVTQPYWLRQPGSVGMYGVSDPALIGTPENAPDLPVVFTVEVQGQTLAFREQLRHANGPAPEHSPVAIVPPVVLRFVGGPAVLRPGATAALELDIEANRGGVSGSVSLPAPAPWKISPPQPFALEREGEIKRLRFELTAPPDLVVGALDARAVVDGVTWTTDSIMIQYPHLPRLRLQPPARKKLVSVPVETRGHTIGYVSGAGDDMPDALRQLGYQVTRLDSADFVAAKLKPYDAIVVGVRAFNTRTDLAALVPALNAYVADGGTVVAQYNWERNLKVDLVGPYRLHLTNRRVTDEHAPVTLLARDHPVLTTPNRITEADFAGWVQERGVYFPDTWDAAFVPILAMNDPGEAPLPGALLVARHGRGCYVYTSLALFRQLPAGVPGAYRLLANLVSLRP